MVKSKKPLEIRISTKHIQHVDSVSIDLMLGDTSENIVYPPQWLGTDNTPEDVVVAVSKMIFHENSYFLQQERYTGMQVEYVGDLSPKVKTAVGYLFKTYDCVNGTKTKFIDNKYE